MEWCNLLSKYTYGGGRAPSMGQQTFFSPHKRHETNTQEMSSVLVPGRNEVDIEPLVSLRYTSFPKHTISNRSVRPTSSSPINGMPGTTSSPHEGPAGCFPPGALSQPVQGALPPKEPPARLWHQAARTQVPAQQGAG